MDNNNLDGAIEHAIELAKLEIPKGKPADYIPELARRDTSKLGIYIKSADDFEAYQGDVETRFTLQSIAKVFSLILALREFSEKEVFSKVAMEPSGAAFSELTTLSDFDEKPNNPFINAGAIVIASMLASKMSFAEYLEFIRRITNNDSIDVNEAVYRSETETNDRNRSLSWELNRLKLLRTTPDEALDFYTLTCSIEVTLKDLSEAGLILVNKGFDPRTSEAVINEADVITCLSLMFTCGLYDGTGNFAVNVGLPAKSGVGGGILAIKPNEYSIATYGAALDKNANSIAGIKLLSELSKDLGWHIFK